MNLANVPVTEVKGVGEESAKQLAALGVTSIAHLLAYFPFRYEDYERKSVTEARHDARVTMEGVIQDTPSIRYYGRKKNRLTFRMLTEDVLISVTLFNRAFLKSKLTIGSAVTVTGKWDQHRLALTASELQLGLSQRDEEMSSVYYGAGKLTSKVLHKWMVNALTQFGEHIVEPLPFTLREKYRLIDKRKTIELLHVPESPEAVRQARRRYVYEEFLLFQLKMHVAKARQRQAEEGASLTIVPTATDKFLHSLSFTLTEGQQQALKDVFADLRAPYRMNRLLQGDVGSGKTVVAAACMFAVANTGNQSALMVPTEILAEQHSASLQTWFAPFGLEVVLLVGSLTAKRRRAALAKIESGEAAIVVGTHALIQETVSFHSLRFVVIDEQHRFGVAQRRLLREKGVHADMLFMTATPIPRTLAITAFGDMDVSVLAELPAGRKPIDTYWLQPDLLPRVLGFMEKALRQGEQAYVICPLIEESEQLDVQNAMDLHTQLVQHFAPNFEVGLMHGRLAAFEKEEVMDAFVKNEVQILVSTTVVEVGVNVPNATVMVIYDADRFGLSQLHQLRGRVGRGEAKSTCVLLAAPKTEVGKERMRMMTETNDGFELAEKDLAIRGPGDFFGAKQSGLPDFKLADVTHDYRTLEVARQDAAEIVSTGALYEDEAYKELLNLLTEEGVFTETKLD
ncbi:ATP-dependent DNA helicase RecG [Shouchella lonarensis]|uniref:ATP-dependent DNA helicase RecG n=1 Tax=Shouchella lonarensis TaxID=1464122 RepID=A0A1G6LAB5_9BACI|nr:ATP-dependent DNA helicase RecG [Shouchella lonarensis]SDC40063.1 ATP-dependent DNA helicase RecG [Shouchella lonarensis]